MDDYEKMKKFLFFQGGIGDSVLLTAAASNLGEQCFVSSSYNDVLENHPLIQIYPIDIHEVLGNRHTYNHVRGQSVQPYYPAYWNFSQRSPGVFYWEYPQIHQIAKLCARIGVMGDIRIEPKVYLTEEEIEKSRPVEQPYVTIQSTGAIWKTPMYDTLAKVAESLSKHFPLIQLGASSDRPFPCAIQSLGTGLRTAAAILAGSEVFVGFLGGLMHLSRAVGTRAVIAFPDSEPLYFSSYTANEHALSEERCSLCWNNTINMYNSSHCPREFICTKSISPQSMLLAFDRVQRRIGAPLEIEIVNNEKEKEHDDAICIYHKLGNSNYSPPSIRAAKNIS